MPNRCRVCLDVRNHSENFRLLSSKLRGNAERAFGGIRIDVNDRISELKVYVRKSLNEEVEDGQMC